MKNLDQFQIDSTANLREAMVAITANLKGIIFVTQNNKVIGALSDGDIRRALLRGVTFITPVTTIMNTNFVFSNTTDKQTVYDMMIEREVFAVPVLNEDRKMIDMFFFDELLAEAKK
jgi:CBS domain-containing protein